MQRSKIPAYTPRKEPIVQRAPRKLAEAAAFCQLLRLWNSPNTTHTSASAPGTQHCLDRVCRVVLSSTQTRVLLVKEINFKMIRGWEQYLDVIALVLVVV